MSNGKDTRATMLNLIRHLAVTIDANNTALEKVELMLEAAHQEGVTLKKK